MDDIITHYSEHNYAYAVGEDALCLRIRVFNNEYDKIIVYYKNLYNHDIENIKLANMEKIIVDEKFSIYEAVVRVEEKRFKYYFELYKKDKKIFYTADGVSEHPQPSNYFYFPCINDDDILDLPKWAEGEIIYQVLVDRFYDGNVDNNPQNCKNPKTLPDRNTYYGGDFDGIIQKLDYIKSLGTKIIYLSPVFKSPTYHKYDVSDYYQIENIYGGKEGLKKLVDEAHKKDLKIILDAVFNHCSYENPIFMDVVNAGINSYYKDWFYIDSFPVDIQNGNYDSFGRLVPSMPRFNTSNEDVMNYLVDVAVYWTKNLDIDGWRCDVADEVATCFWRLFRKRLKAVKSDLLLVGEVWNQATKWLQGDQFDTVTNYQYRKWLISFLTDEIKTDELWNRINRNKMLYKTPFFNYLVNLVGSHDTIRLLTHLKNPIRHYLALAFSLTIDGMPLIYYGDEIGMEGDVDPDNRRAFSWEKTENNKELDMIKSIGKLREKSKALRLGETLPLNVNEKLIMFYRIYKDEKLLVVINFEEKPKIFSIKAQKVLAGLGLILLDEIAVDLESMAIFQI